MRVMVLVKATEDSEKGLFLNTAGDRNARSDGQIQ